MTPRARYWLAAGLGLLTSCQDSTPLVVLLPELAEHEVAFLVSVVDGVSKPAVGPIPLVSAAAELRDGDELYLFVVDTDALASVHERVDVTRWSELRLVEQPAVCSDCSSACRGTANDLLFHPSSSTSRLFELDGAEFVPLSESPLSAAWLQLPARWNCTDIRGGRNFEVVDEWPAGLIHQRMKLIGGEHLLGLGDALRLLEARPEQIIAPPEGSYFLSASGHTSDRAWVLVVNLDRTPGMVWELGLGANRLEVVREIQLPFYPADLHADEQGLVVIGTQGQIATSTDGLSFVESSIAERPGVSALARLGDEDAPFLAGSGMGSLWRGDPWRPQTRWSTERLRLIVDSSVAQFVRTQSGSQSILWARTVERGFYLQRGREPWEPLRVDMPSDQPRCRISTDACGFAEPPARTRQTVTNADTAFVLADNCQVLLAMKPNDGCASSIELVEDETPFEYPYAVALKNDFLYVVLANRLLRTPAAPLY